MLPIAGDGTVHRFHDAIQFETKMKELSNTLYLQMKESAELDAIIRKNPKGLGYGE